MRSNLIDAIPKIVKSLELNLNPSTNKDGQVINILLNLPKLFSTSKARVEKNAIFQIHPVNTLLSSIVPAPSEPPCLIAISRSSSFDDLSVMAYVDGQCSFTEKGFEAVLLLLAVYWVYNINFPKIGKYQFSFMAAAVLREAASAPLKNVFKLPSFSNALTKAQLD